MNANVVVARNNLAAAEAEEQKDRREAARLEVERLTEEGAAMEMAFDKLSRQVKSAEGERLALHDQIWRTAEEIEQLRAPMDPLSFPLPTKQQRAERERRLPLLEAHHAALMVKFADAQRRESSRLDCVKLANAIAAIRSAIANYVTIAQGREPGEVRGSINYYSGDNFLRGNRGGLRGVV